ncbi:MAG: hypothetical protein H7A27_09545 [Spirochaetaceae bacterium]|nr:hypothetical protein [Spirochaetaceae bacterium]
MTRKRAKRSAMLAAACGLAVVALLETAFGGREASADVAERRVATATDSGLYTVPGELRSLKALARRLGDMTSATVTRIVDGDTVVVELPGGEREKVRLIGVDTPESVDPRKPVERFSGPPTSPEGRLLGGNVRLAFGPGCATTTSACSPTVSWTTGPASTWRSYRTATASRTSSTRSVQDRFSAAEREARAPDEALHFKP